MFNDLGKAKEHRATFVVGKREEIEFRKGYDKQDRPNIMEVKHKIDIDAQGKDVSPVQMNEVGLYFFTVGDRVVEDAN